MKVVRQISTSRIVYREDPDFEVGKGIANAVVHNGYSKADLKEIEVTQEEWEHELWLRLHDQGAPKSMHIAALIGVDAQNKKGTVTRKWMGQNYTYDNCYVSLQALEAYQAGKLKLFNPAYGIKAPQNADSFVLVYFVSENPYDEAIEIPVIIDKLVK